MIDRIGDVTFYEDMIFVLQNLVAIENHAIGSYYQSKNKRFLELNDIVREMRQKWIQGIIKKENSQVYCITKHMLGAIMGMQEIANRYAVQGKDKESEEAQKDAENLLKLLGILNDLK